MKEFLRSWLDDLNENHDYIVLNGSLLYTINFSLFIRMKQGDEVDSVGFRAIMDREEMYVANIFFVSGNLFVYADHCLTLVVMAIQHFTTVTTTYQIFGLTRTVHQRLRISGFIKTNHISLSASHTTTHAMMIVFSSMKSELS